MPCSVNRAAAGRRQLAWAAVLTSHDNARCDVTAGIIIIGPMLWGHNGAIAVPPVTRCRCRHRCCRGHRCAGGVRQ